MSIQAYAKELEVAIRAVGLAARLCRNVQSEIAPGALQKKDRSPVTVADFGSQALICRALAEAFPDDPVIGEEDSGALGREENRPLLDRLVRHVGAVLPGASATGICGWIDRGSATAYAPRYWTLDPIDGTKGFLRREQYAIALALVVGGQIEVALLGCPSLSDRSDRSDPSDSSDSPGTLFFAVRNQGAFEQPLEGPGAPRPVRVSATADPRQIRFCESVEEGHSSHGDAARIAERLGIGAAPVRVDSQAKYALVARGEADAYMRLPKQADYREKIWDHAAGALVVAEAGGRVTDIRGLPLSFTHGTTMAENQGVIASNGPLHDAILESIRVLRIGF